MPVKFSNTADEYSEHIKALVYGAAGIGKTVLCATAPTPIIISAEAGLLSLAHKNIPAIIINNRKDCNDAYDWCSRSKEAKQFQTVCLDSLSEISEVLLADEKRLTKDPRQAYGVMNDEMTILIRSFRDLPGFNVYFSCKLRKIVDDSTGMTSYMPGVPGQGLLQQLPYYFDEVFAMRMGKLADGTTYRYLQTQPDIQWDAKDRSGMLNAIEQPDLSVVFNKIREGINVKRDVGKIPELAQLTPEELEEAAASSAASEW